MEVTFAKDPTANPSTPVEQKPVIEVAAVVTPAPTAETPAAPTAPAAPVTVPAVTGAGAVARPNNALLLGDVLPDFSEMILPRINLVQNIGGLKDSFEPGTLLYNQQTPLFIPGRINDKTKTVERQATPPVKMTFIGFRPTRYVEKVIGGGKGLMVKTEAEVTAAGGTLDYTEWKLKEKSGMKRFEPLADGMVVIERPELVADDDTIFVYDINGKKYALALWAVRGTSYTNLCKRVLFPARRMGALRHGGFPSWSYNLSSSEVPFGQNRSWIPVAVPCCKNTPEMLSFVKEIVEGAATSSTPEGEAGES